MICISLSINWSLPAAYWIPHIRCGKGQRSVQLSDCPCCVESRCADSLWETIIRYLQSQPSGTLITFQTDMREAAIVAHVRSFWSVSPASQTFLTLFFKFNGLLGDSPVRMTQSVDRKWVVYLFVCLFLSFFLFILMCNLCQLHLNSLKSICQLNLLVVLLY